MLIYFRKFKAETPKSKDFDVPSEVCGCCCCCGSSGGGGGRGVNLIVCFFWDARVGTRAL